MFAKIRCLLWLAAASVVFAGSGGSSALAQKPTPTPTPLPALTTSRHFHIPPTPGSGKIAIYIVNEYEVDLNFGPVGKGHRYGTDEANGILTRQGADYVGTLDASVDSVQNVAGLGTHCGPQRYNESQKLKVIARLVDGFPAPAYTGPLYHPGTYTGTASNEYVMLEFSPVTRTATQPRSFDPVTNQLTVNCHDLIIPQGDDTDDDDTSAAPPPPGFVPGRFDGIAFLPFNDTRWTTKGQGYIVRLPASGVLKYTDTQPPGTVFGLLTSRKSVWTIEFERVP